MELGRYDDAARATERMERLRPGLSAHARVAALRAVAGDRRGAVAALEAALATADRADAEERAWLFTYLGHEHWALGELAAARVAYEAALRAFPDYHLVLPGLARVRAASGDAAGAIELYERALTLAPTPSVAGALGDLYAAGGDPARARATYDFAMYMGRVATARGRTLGRELATFLVDHDRDLAEAEGLAAADAVRRHDVYTDDALAWALAANGRLVEAKRAMSRALRLGTEEAGFDFHAGMIAVRLGRTRTGARRLRRALALNPYFDAGQARMARTTLTGLEG
jgi:tetratricopeptide (TPR) repeat protein